jgi:hypothetical protein
VKKEMLCEAFCQDLDVASVPVGLVVRTGFMARDGDAIGFYLTRHPQLPGQWRVEDSGLVIPMLEAAGVNLESGARAQAFHRLLDEYSASFDADALELHSEYVAEQDLPAEALRFVALLLRVQDLELLSTESVASTFRDDVVAALDRHIAKHASIAYKVAPHESLREYEVDALISYEGNALALYLGTSDERVNEAVILRMEISQRKSEIKVALMLEREKPSQINNRSLRRAMNRLDATTVYRDVEFGSLSRLAAMVGVPQPVLQ